ncbi:Uma2 family endonuclease [Kitasatospora sp. NPDC096147]|uniref:Uma2 family endonuclease n=1 Tax=Kitasatospora sp. NPDC096147 TaxID=3364093 RepID=UPI0038114881
MTATVVEHGTQWEYLLRTWRELDVPEGWRAEVEGGRILLAPPPGKGHNYIAGEVHTALLRCLSADVGVYQTLGTQIARLQKVCVPDLVVVEKSALTGSPDPDADPVDAADVLMAVEITSSGNARHDRTKKLWAYAHAPVPLYLLIDRFDEHEPTVTLFSKPLNGAYQVSVRTPFGKPVALPGPFDVELATEGFPLPG